MENEHSKALTDLPTVKFYYQINDGEKIFFDGSFTLPKSIKGLKITIAAVTDEIDGKYSQAIDYISFSTQASDENESNDSSNQSGAGNSSSTNNQNGAGNAPSEDNSGNTNDVINGNSTEKATSANNENTVNNSESSNNNNQPSSTQKSGKDIENMINGCFASTSISAIALISLIFGYITIKKKND